MEDGYRGYLLDYILKIGVSLGGSVGDMINASALCCGLKRQFPQSHITFFCGRGSEVFQENKIINDIKVISNNFEKEIENKSPIFDIFCFIRYPVKYTFSDKALKIPEVAKFKIKWEKVYKNYYETMYEEFLTNINRLNNFCYRNSKTVYDIRRDSSCLNYSDDDQFLYLSEEDYTASNSFNNLRMVTINNSGIVGTMTKSWSSQSWLEITKYLRKRGLYVVQLGLKGEPNIPGINERFYGTLRQTAAMIKRSQFCIFIEGGLVHVARAVNKKSIVLFGPTPTYVFGYPENINIKGTECFPCWHTKPSRFDWNKVCVKSGIEAKKETPACMQSLSYFEVIKAIDKILIDSKIIVKEGIKNV